MSRTSAIDLPAIAHLERLAVVAASLADLARDVHVGQEVHLDLDGAVALAGLAAPALDVEREAAWLVAAHACVGRLRVELADAGRTARCTSQDSSAASARSATGRSRSPCRTPRAPRSHGARPARTRIRCSRFCSALCTISLTSVDLPDPETPVTATKQPTGISTSTSRRLCWLAPSRAATAAPGVRRTGTAISSTPRQERARQRRPACATPAPPCPRRRRARRARRRPGPCRSASRTRASSPRRARRRSPCCRGRADARAWRSGARLSRWCSPIDGSSRMYSTPTRLDPICVASRMRCASPPESVRRAAREREVAEPDVVEEGEALARSRAGCARRSCDRSRRARGARRTSAPRAPTSARTESMLSPPTVTASDSGCRRAPWQAGHARSAMYCSIRSFCSADSVSR